MAMKPPKKATPKPAMAAAAPDDDDDMDGGAGAEGAGGDEDEGEDGGPTVLLTVMDNHDGTYTLVHGDEPEAGEPEEGEGEGEGAGGPEGEEGENNAPGGEEDEEPEAGEGEEGPAQEHFDNPGALMKGILDILNQAESENGSGEAAFSAGFGASHTPTPKK